MISLCMLQQYLPLAVLKPAKAEDRNATYQYAGLQQYLPLAVLKLTDRSQLINPIQLVLQQYLPLAVLKPKTAYRID